MVSFRCRAPLAESPSSRGSLHLAVGAQSQVWSLCTDQDMLPDSAASNRRDRTLQPAVSAPTMLGAAGIDCRLPTTAMIIWAFHAGHPVHDRWWRGNRCLLASDISGAGARPNWGVHRMTGMTEAEAAYQFTAAQARAVMTAITAVALIAATAVFLLIV